MINASEADAMKCHRANEMVVGCDGRSGGPFREGACELGGGRERARCFLLVRTHSTVTNDDQFVFQHHDDEVSVLMGKNVN